MKKLMILLAMASLGMTAAAQTDNQQELPILNEQQSKYIPVFQYWKEHDIFQHLDVSLSAGTTGIGLEVSSPIGEYVKLRAGFDYMPRFTAKMEFLAMIGDQPARQGNQVSSTFARMQTMLYDFTGVTVEDHVDMVGKPTMNNFKLLLDVFPFKNDKRWFRNVHFTAGFYWGPSKFAEAVNTTESMNSLIALSIYNNLYDKSYIHQTTGVPQYIIVMPDPDDPDDASKNTQLGLTPTMEEKFLGFGRMGFRLGEFAHDVYDADGNIIHAKGDTYVMDSDDRNMVVVKAKTNSFKPYLGVGYDGCLVKGRDDWKIGFNAGLWIWGGSPDLYLHDGVNLTTDVTNITGQVGDYVNLIKKFKVYPVLEVKLTKRIF